MLLSVLGLYFEYSKDQNDLQSFTHSNHFSTQPKRLRIFLGMILVYQNGKFQIFVSSYFPSLCLPLSFQLSHSLNASLLFLFWKVNTEPFGHAFKNLSTYREYGASASSSQQELSMEGLGNLPRVSYLKVVMVTLSSKFSILMNFSRLRSNCLALFHSLCEKFSTYLRPIIFFPVLEPSNISFLKILLQLPFPPHYHFSAKRGKGLYISQSFDSWSCLSLSPYRALCLHIQLSNAGVTNLFL